MVAGGEIPVVGMNEAAASALMDMEAIAGQGCGYVDFLRKAS